MILDGSNLVLTNRAVLRFCCAVLVGPVFSLFLKFFGLVFGCEETSYIDGIIYSIAASVWIIVYYYGSFLYDLDKYGPHTREHYVNHIVTGEGGTLFFVFCILYIFVIFLMFYRKSRHKYIAAFFSAGSFLFISAVIQMCVYALPGA